MFVQDLDISGKVHFRGQKVGISIRVLSKENIDVLQIGGRGEEHDKREREGGQRFM